MDNLTRSEKLSELVAAAQPLLPERPYREAVDLAATASWWRDAFTALHCRVRVLEAACLAVADLDMEVHEFGVADGIVTDKILVKSVEAFEEARAVLKAALGRK